MTRPVFAALLLLMLGLGLLAFVPEFRADEAAFDFAIYQRAYTAAAAGESAYYPYDIGTSFVYHPFALTLMTPFSAFPPGAAYALWTALSLAAYAAAVIITVRATRLSAFANENTLLLLLFAFLPLWQTLYNGQINTFALLALALAFAWSRRGWAVGAGAALALAIVLKLSPALLLGYFVVRRQWRIVAAALVVLALLTLIPLAQFGAPPLTEFVDVTLNTGVGLAISEWNLNPFVLGVRLGADGVTMALAHKVFAVVAVAMLLVIGWRARAADEARLFGLFVVLMVYVSPLIWAHHAVFLALPALLLMQPSAALPQGEGENSAADAGVWRARPVLLPVLALLLVQADALTGVDGALFLLAGVVLAGGAGAASVVGRDTLSKQVIQ